MPLRCEGYFGLAGPLGTPLGLAQWNRASSRGEAGTSGFLSISEADRRVPAELGQESQAPSCLRKGTPLASRVAQGVSGPLSSCVWPCGCFQTMPGGVSAPLCCAFTHKAAFEEVSGHRVLIQSGPGDPGRSTCGTTHGARLGFPRETGLVLWCAGKAGNAFQTTQGNRLSCRDQEGRRGSEQAVPGPSVFHSREPGVSGNFWGSHEGCQVPFRTSGRNMGFPWRRRSGQGPHLVETWEPRGFSRIATRSSNYDGDFMLPLGLDLGSPIFHSRCEGKLGVAVKSL